MKIKNLVRISFGLLFAITGAAYAADPAIKTNLPKTSFLTSESFSLSYYLLNSRGRRVTSPTGTVTLNSYTNASCSAGQSPVGSSIELATTKTGTYSFPSPGTFYLKPILTGYTGNCLGPITVLGSSGAFEQITMTKTSQTASSVTVQARWESLSGSLSTTTTTKINFQLSPTSACSTRISGSRAGSYSQKLGVASISFPRPNAATVYACASAGAIKSSLLIPVFDGSSGTPGTNRAPVASSQSVTATEDSNQTISLSATDLDGNALTYQIVTQPTNGVLSGSGSSRTYTPNANYSGADSFTFRVNDGTVNSNTATVSITVSSVNDAPVAVADSGFTATAGSALSILASQLLSNDTDLDNDSLSVTSVQSPSTGTVSIAGNSISFTPEISFAGTATFSYTITDGSLTSTASVSVVVSCAQGFQFDHESNSCIETIPTKNFELLTKIINSDSPDAYTVTSIFDGADFSTTDIITNSSNTGYPELIGSFKDKLVFKQASGSGESLFFINSDKSVTRVYAINGAYNFNQSGPDSYPIFEYTSFASSNAYASFSDESHLWVLATIDSSDGYEHYGKIFKISDTGLIVGSIDIETYSSSNIYEIRKKIGSESSLIILKYTWETGSQSWAEFPKSMLGLGSFNSITPGSSIYESNLQAGSNLPFFGPHMSQLNHPIVTLGQSDYFFEYNAIGQHILTKQNISTGTTSVESNYSYSTQDLYAAYFMKVTDSRAVAVLTDISGNLAKVINILPSGVTESTSISSVIGVSLPDDNPLIVDYKNGKAYLSVSSEGYKKVIDLDTGSNLLDFLDTDATDQFFFLNGELYSQYDNCSPSGSCDLYLVKVTNPTNYNMFKFVSGNKLFYSHPLGEPIEIGDVIYSSLSGDMSNSSINGGFMGAFFQSLLNKM